MTLQLAPAQLETLRMGALIVAISLVQLLRA